MRGRLETEEGEKEVTREARSGKTCLENALLPPRERLGTTSLTKKKKGSYIVFVCLFLKRNIKYKILNQIQKMSCRECHIWAALCGLCSCSRENKGI